MFPDSPCCGSERSASGAVGDPIPSQSHGVVEAVDVRRELPNSPRRGRRYVKYPSPTPEWSAILSVTRSSTVAYRAHSRLSTHNAYVPSRIYRPVCTESQCNSVHLIPYTLHRQSNKLHAFSNSKLIALLSFELALMPRRHLNILLRRLKCYGGRIRLADAVKASS